VRSECRHTARRGTHDRLEAREALQMQPCEPGGLPDASGIILEIHPAVSKIPPSSSVSRKIEPYATAEWLTAAD
jgi:hypothetical protein